MSFKRYLESVGSCSSAVEWVGKKGLNTSWKTCPRGDWLMWFIVRSKLNPKLIVRAAVAVAGQNTWAVSDKNESLFEDALWQAQCWTLGKAQSLRAASKQLARAMRYPTYDDEFYALLCAQYVLDVIEGFENVDAYVGMFCPLRIVSITSDLMASCTGEGRKTSQKRCAEIIRSKVSLEDVGAAVKALSKKGVLFT